MELALLIGIPAVGKSSFCRARLFDTHVRLCRDVLRTRHREQVLFAACLASQTRVAIDNTNVTREERAAFIAPARAAGFRVVGYYFQADLSRSLARNAAREGEARVPDVGVLDKHAQLQLPSRAEGFDALYYVRQDDAGYWIVEQWRQAST